MDFPTVKAIFGWLVAAASTFWVYEQGSIVTFAASIAVTMVIVYYSTTYVMREHKREMAKALREVVETLNEDHEKFKRLAEDIRSSE